MAYTFSHSITCSVSVKQAWQFWSDVDNWAVVDPSVESVSLDGPFIAGTKGKTETGGSVGHWKLIEVHDGRGAVIEISLPAAVLRFHWVFEELVSGVQITQRVVLEGERAGDESQQAGLGKTPHG